MIDVNQLSKSFFSSFCGVACTAFEFFVQESAKIQNPPPPGLSGVTRKFGVNIFREFESRFGTGIFLRFGSLCGIPPAIGPREVVITWRFRPPAVMMVPLQDFNELYSFLCDNGGKIK